MLDEGSGTQAAVLDFLVTLFMSLMSILLSAGTLSIVYKTTLSFGLQMTVGSLQGDQGHKSDL